MRGATSRLIPGGTVVKVGLAREALDVSIRIAMGVGRDGRDLAQAPARGKPRHRPGERISSVDLIQINDAPREAH